MVAAENTLHTTRVRAVPELERYREAWELLAAKAPMRSPLWFITWWRHYAGAEDELCVLLFQDGAGELVGVAPLYLERKGKRRTLRLLGSGDASTNHTTWLAAAGWERGVASAVADFLTGSRQQWDSLQLDCVDSDDLAINATAQQLADRGYLVHRRQLQSCWKVALPSSWDQFLGMLSRTNRKRRRKQYRDFFESGRIQFHQVASEAEFERGFEILLRLHAARWGEPKRPLGCFSDSRFLEFHKDLARKLLERKQLLLTWLEYDGKPIAAEYQFIDDDTLYSYQAGMDPTVTELPPGNLSIMASIHFAITHGCRWFDFSRGDQPYKANWRATASGCQDLRIWPGNFTGHLQKAKWDCRQALERKRLLSARWVKSRVPPGCVDSWRQMLFIISGKRVGPRKTGSSE